MPGTVVPLTMFIRKVPCTTNSHVSRTRTSSRKQLCLAGTWGRGEGWLVSCLQPSYKSWWLPFTHISLISSSFAKRSCDCIKRFWEGEARRKRERWQQGSKSQLLDDLPLHDLHRSYTSRGAGELNLEAGQLVALLVQEHQT